MPAFDTELLRRIAPVFAHDARRAARQQDIIGAIGPILQATLVEYDMATPLRAAHFLAQTCTESFGFSTTEEEASGQAYEGRRDLGNTQRGDGPRFKGRGLIQLTGRTNYALYSEAPNLDLIAHPELAADPSPSLRLACEYWKNKALNTFADWDDALTITCRINGGFNGLDTRLGYLAKAKAALGAVGVAPALPILRRGAKGPAVVRLQVRLRRQGYAVGTDGDFGSGTETALIEFQGDNGLQADGEAGPAVWDALETPLA